MGAFQRSVLVLPPDWRTNPVMQEKPVRLVAELTFTQTIHTKIRGVTFRGAQAVIPLCHVGDDLLLLREKNRPEYPNAIEVRHLQDHLGYISDDLAERLAPVMDAGVEPSATITAITGGGE